MKIENLLTHLGGGGYTEGNFEISNGNPPFLYGAVWFLWGKKD